MHRDPNAQRVVSGCPTVPRSLPHCALVACLFPFSRCATQTTQPTMAAAACSTVPASASTTAARPLRLLCLCLGNICRSPLAEGILRREIERRGLKGWVRRTRLHTEASG